MITYHTIRIASCDRLEAGGAEEEEEEEEVVVVMHRRCRRLEAVS